MRNCDIPRADGSMARGLICFFVVAVLIIPVWAAPGWSKNPLPATTPATKSSPASAPATPAPPEQAKMLADLNQALQQQIKEFNEQLTQSQNDFKKIEEDSQSLGVAISTHKAALSLDKITLHQSKELQQYYARLAQEKAAAVAALTLEIEKYAKIHDELEEATQKAQGDKAHPDKTPAKTAVQRALAQQNQQYLKLATTAIGKLEELQKSSQSRLDVLKQEQASLEEFSLTLQKFAEEKFKSQLLERQKPIDKLTLTKQLLAESIGLPQRLYNWLLDKIHSGAVRQLIKLHRSKLIGLLFFLGILLYAMKLLRRATQDFRRKLAAGAVSFSLKLIMALTNSLAKNYYLLAITIWLALTLWIMGNLDHPAAKILLGGLAAITIIRLLKPLLTALFAPNQPDQGIFDLDLATARYYSRSGFAGLLFFVSGYYFLWSLRLLGEHYASLKLVVFIFLIVMILWFAWLLRKPYLENLLAGTGLSQHSWLAGLIASLRLLVLLGLGIIIAIALLGFQNLALYLAWHSFLTALLVAGGWLVEQMGRDLNTFLTRPGGFLSRAFDLRNETLDGFHFIFAQVFTLLISFGVIVGILAIWGIDLTIGQRILALLSRGPSLGPVTLSPLAIILAVLSIWVARRLSGFTRLILQNRIYYRRGWDIGIQHTISNTIHYTFMTLGIIMALGFLGINYANLAFIAGGLGVGIGFGLQNIVNNFFSGLILLFERPIKVGDLLVIDGQWGTVKDIRVRSTLFETSERAVLIIPNSDLISNKILNWTFNGQGPNRLTLNVGVAYDSDVHQVTNIINQICDANHRVLKEPPPQVYFNAYGDSSLNFTVWVFVRTPSDRIPATHELNAAIFDAFNQHGIEFPYPQMDLHIRSVAPKLQQPVPLPLETEEEQE